MRYCDTRPPQETDPPRPSSVQISETVPYPRPARPAPHDLLGVGELSASSVTSSWVGMSKGVLHGLTKIPCQLYFFVSISSTSKSGRLADPLADRGRLVARSWTT